MKPGCSTPATRLIRAAPRKIHRAFLDPAAVVDRVRGRDDRHDDAGVRRHRDACDDDV